MTATAPSAVSMHCSNTHISLVRNRRVLRMLLAPSNPIPLPSSCNDRRYLEPASRPLLYVLQPAYRPTNHHYLRWASLTTFPGILIFTDNHRHNRSCASDLITSSASHLVIFTSFLGFRASGGVPSRGLFLHLGARVDCMPYYNLWSQHHTGKNRVSRIWSERLSCSTFGEVYYEASLGATSQSRSDNPWPWTVVPSSVRNGW